MKRLLLTLSFLLLSSPASAAWPNGYTYRSQIDTDPTKAGGSNSAGFILTINGTYADLKDTGSGGKVINVGGGIPYDLIFTSDANGAVPLNWEVERYTNTTGAITVHVSIGTLSSSVATTIYLFVGKASVVTFQGGAHGTVCPTGLVSMWHLPNGTTLTAADSCASNDGTLSGTPPTATAGVMDGAGAFASASSEYISITDDASLRPNHYTISAWIKRAAASGANEEWVFSNWYRASGPAYYGPVLYIPGTGATQDRIVLFHGEGNSNFISSASTALTDTTTFHQVVGEWDSADNYLKVFIDGSASGTPSAQGNAPAYSVGNQGVRIGDDAYVTAGTPSEGGYFNGVIDEVRLWNISLSADRLLADYNNGNAPSTFYSVGTFDTSGAASVGPKHRVVQE